MKTISDATGRKKILGIRFAATALLIVTATLSAIAQKYSDGRPEATMRMEAKDHGIVLQYGDGPGKCDLLGARDVWVFEDSGTYYMHYDAAGPKGWLCSQAVSKDLVTWDKKGPILDFGKPGEDDSKSASYGVTYWDGKEWHMFYLGTPNVSDAPDLVPSFPYLTMKAKGNSGAGPWIKQKDVVPFRTKPNTYYSITASPGEVIKYGDEYLQFFSATTRMSGNPSVQRTLGIARTKDLDDSWIVDPKPMVPIEEQIENSTLYYEKSNNTWFLFTNHIGIDNGEYTDAIWVYWSKDLNKWNPGNKAIVLDGLNCTWSKKCIGLPSVVPFGKRLALFYDAPGGNSTSHMGRNIGLAWLDLPLSPPERNLEKKLVPVGKGWAMNSVNANILRHNSVATYKNTQYVAYYDEDGFVILAKRQLGSEKWEIEKTPYTGNVKDAHNSISIMVDGDGYLHMSWDHHGDSLRYCRSRTPGSLELTAKMPMTGKKEDRVTYPEFYRLPDGNLLFLYRDGVSGRGNLMMNHYDLKTKKWTQRQDGFINGEGNRNAYWQLCTDTKGAIHISWVWRETADVASNHDMGYAKSADGGKTWQKSNGEKYRLPITASNTEYAAHIPEGHELINTTSMCADTQGRPYIATFWRPEGTEVPQYHLIYHDGARWHTSQISNRETPFRLSGGGTKRLPISRPRILADCSGSTDKAYMLFRDTERGDCVSVAICRDLKKQEWQFKDLTDFSVGMWEPSYDTWIWKRSKMFHIYVQKVGQGDGEMTEDIAPHQVSILEWKPE